MSCYSLMRPLAIFFLITITANAGDDKSLSEWQDDIRYGQNILKAGETGNPALKDVLHRRLEELQRTHRAADAMQIHELKLALAKLGDQDKLREVYCALYSNNAVTISGTTQHGLKYIGGWFAIRALLEMLDSDKRFSKWENEQASDVSLQMPSMVALLNLKTLVPEAPIEYSEAGVWDSQKRSEYAAFWKKYVKEHEAELRKTEPTASDNMFRVCQAQETRALNRR